MRLLNIVLALCVLMVAVQPKPIYKEIARSLGYDETQASNAGEGASNAIRGLIDSLSFLDPFKPIIDPSTVSALNTVEFLGGFISSVVGFVIKTVVSYIYNSDLLNDTPFIGELIRNVQPTMVSTLPGS